MTRIDTPRAGATGSARDERRSPIGVTGRSGTRGRALALSLLARTLAGRTLLLRAAAICGLAALASFVVGVVLADVAQPAAFSPLNDDISDLGALTASSPWFYNQVAANLTGILVLGFALGLWAALGRGLLSRVGVLGLVVVGTGIFLDGLFRLDCQGIDAGCDNTSWHSSAHKIESGITAAALLLTPFVLAFAFKRRTAWRRLWLPTLFATPALFATSAAFSPYGPGVTTRVGSAVWFLWLALVAFRLLHALADTAPAGALAAAGHN